MLVAQYRKYAWGTTHERWFYCYFCCFIPNSCTYYYLLFFMELYSCLKFLTPLLALCMELHADFLILYSTSCEHDWCVTRTLPVTGGHCLILLSYFFLPFVLLLFSTLTVTIIALTWATSLDSLDCWLLLLLQHFSFIVPHWIPSVFLWMDCQECHTAELYSEKHSWFLLV